MNQMMNNHANHPDSITAIDIEQQQQKTRLKFVKYWLKERKKIFRNEWKNDATSGCLMYDWNTKEFCEIISMQQNAQQHE